MSRETRYFGWGLIATIAAIVIYLNGQDESTALAEDLYTVCRALEKSAPHLLGHYPDLKGIEAVRAKHDLSNPGIRQACDAHPGWFAKLDRRAVKQGGTLAR